MKEDPKYAYGVGRIRALEARLLSKQRIEQMVEARTGEKALLLLSDTDYSPFLSELKDIKKFEEVLNKELKRVLGLISKLSHDPELTDLFHLRYDFQNLKLLLKARYLTQHAVNREPFPPKAGPPLAETVNHLIDAGLIDPEEMKRIVNEGDYRELPEEMRLILEKAVKEYEESKDPQIIDILIDREMHSLFMRKAKEKKNRSLIELFQTMIDLSNIKNFIRVRELEKDRDFFKKAFLPSGRLDQESFLRIYEEPLDSLTDILKETPYLNMVKEALLHWEWVKNRSLSELERASDNFILRYLRRARWLLFDLQPLIAYLLAKENEIKLIRMVMVGKLNNLPKDLIKERLRDTYV